MQESETIEYKKSLGELSEGLNSVAAILTPIYKDRVEIRNPGILMDGISLKTLKTGKVSRRRNPLIADLLRRIHLVEAWGRGIPLILDKAPDVRFHQVAGIEQNMHQDVIVGNELDSIVRFYGVHFENKPEYESKLPMITCGKEPADGNVQVAFDHCAFFGNGDDRVAIAIQQGVKYGEVIGTRFENFKSAIAPIKVLTLAGNYYERGLVVLPARHQT